MLLDTVYARLVGLIVERVEAGVGDDFVLVHFTDGTKWLLVPERWNAAGARLRHLLSWSQDQPTEEKHG